MSQVFDFDGALQMPAPGVFVMETGGGGEGEEPEPEESTGDTMARSVAVSITRSLVRSVTETS